MILPLLLWAVALIACTTTPPKPPPAAPPPEPPPQPKEEPEPPPPPEPKGTAPLVGTTWKLHHQYRSEEIAVPPKGTVELLFTEEDGSLLVAEGPESRITGEYSYELLEKESAPLDYEEGTLTVTGVSKPESTGRYHRYEKTLASNLGLAQGYYIRGDHPEESELTIFGGYGREEIILLELRAAQ